MIGYPDQPVNYTFPINSDTYAENVLSGRAEAFVRRISSLNKPADRKRWDMSPATVNAYYDPTRNIMVFPEGILQTPYFNLTFPLPLRFGGAGMIMGHEVRFFLPRCWLLAVGCLLVCYSLQFVNAAYCRPRLQLSHGFDNQGRGTHSW